MSYIINCGDPFVSTKLTEKGREKLAKGKLNFTSWAIGDSEINYVREELLENNVGIYSGTTSILRPKDKQPNFKSYISKNDLSLGNTPFYDITNANLKTLKLTVSNKSEERGFFSGSTLSGWTTLTTDYTLDYGLLSASTLTGGTYLNVPGLSYNIGDYILLKISNDVLGPVTPASNIEPIPSLWYKIQNTASTDTIIVDRNLPNMSADTTEIEVYVYPSGEVYDTYGSGTTTAYWDTNTLSFDASCDISVGDVNVLNMNTVFSETLQGIDTSTYEDFSRYGSYQYIGEKDPYFNYDMTLSSSTALTQAYCSGESIRDLLSKSIALIHYTNKTISNFYGEYFHIDTENDKLLKLHLPTLMYHRRYFTGGTENGDVMGMSFVSDGDSKVLTNTDIEYYDLIEDPDMIFSGGTPQIVGKVFPQLKVVVIDDDEIVASLSYKSNRNWTLPTLALELVAPTATTAVLEKGKTMFMTYMLKPTSGLTTNLPCQYFAKLKNNTTGDRDVQFRINGIDNLPYMRKTEKGGYDGRGFYANELKIIYQIVDEDIDRPTSDSWNVLDFTTTGMTSGGTIDPIILENQSPITNNFILNYSKSLSATTFDVTTDLSLPLKINPNYLQFGDERFFYGNLETYIGATIYKTLFELRLNAAEFQYTTNPTKLLDTGDPTNLRVSEIGIYDSDNDLVIVGKLSEPVEVIPGTVIMFELGLDF